MKHLGPREAQLLADLLQSAGIVVSREVQVDTLRYLDGVIDANTRLNLTRISGAEAGVRLHIVDSLLALEEVEASPPGPLLDVGTGGGFPGVPLCLASGREGVLIDSVGKKARAVDEILAELGMASRIRTISIRAEEAAAQDGARFAVVTARAVSELPALVELASPLLAPGGRLIALKGAPDEGEFGRAQRVCAMVGMKETSRRRLVVPGGEERRTVVSYTRVGPPSLRLPRRNGMAQTSPLA